MHWETPTFTEIDMSAEIGAYQSDFGPEPQPAPQYNEPEQD